MIKFFLIFILTSIQSQNFNDEDLVTSAFNESNPNKSLELLGKIQKERELSDSLQILCYLTYGIAYGKLGKEDSSLLYLNKCLKNPTYKYLFIKAGNAKGLVFFHAGKYEDALISYQKALEMARQNNFREEEATILGNMGGVYFQTGNYPSAIRDSEKSLEIAYELDDTDDIAYGHLRLAVVYEEIDSLELSKYHNSKASQYAENLGNFVLLTYIEKTLGNIYKKLNQLDSSLYRHKRAKAFAEAEGEEDNIASTSAEIAKIYLEMGDHDMAEKEANEVILLSSQNRYPVHTKTAHDILYQIALEQKDFRRALIERNKYIQINDSLNAVETRERVAELEIKYETTQKEKEIIEANAEIDRKSRFQLFLLIVIGVILLFSSVAITLLIQRFRLKRALLSQEIDTLRAQINSIFGGGTQKLNLTLEQINNGLFKPLSEREFEILNEAISEKTNSEIAETVFVSVNTVKTHLKNIYMKLGVSNRKEALEVLLSKA